MKKLITFLIMVFFVGVLSAQTSNWWRYRMNLHGGVKVGNTIVNTGVNKTGSLLIPLDSISGDNATTPTLFKIYRGGVQLNPDIPAAFKVAGVALADSTGNAPGNYMTRQNVLVETALKVAKATMPTTIGIACSDETTALTASTSVAKVTFRMPYAMTVTAVRASVTTAPTDATILVDIHESGTTILSTKIMIDATELTSTTATTPYVIADATLADDASITLFADQVGSTIAGAGLKIWIIGTRVAP